MTVRKTALHNLTPGLSAEDERLTGGFGLWTPSSTAAGMHARGGIIPQRTGQNGEVTVNSDTSATINPFRLVAPGTQGNYQGDYVAVSDAAQALTIGARQAGVSRLDLLVTRVRDTGYTPNESADDVVTSVVAGTPAASSPVAPTAPPNSYVHGTFTVPATGAGSVTFAYTNLWAVAVGGISPTPVGATDTAAGAYVGQYRDLPTLGLQRWNGTIWQRVGGGTDAAALTAVPAGTGWSAAAATGLNVMVDGFRRATLSGWASNNGTFTPAGGEVICTIPSGFRPSVPKFYPAPVSSLGNAVAHLDMSTAGVVSIARAPAVSIPAGTLWGLDFSYLT